MNNRSFRDRNAAMEILSVSLTNFKSHRDRQVTFQPGTNAICGENGAGKTSILEAIAWVLFDYRGRYKVEDLIHNDAASAQARIVFVSSRDHRTYEVSRCTRTGYTIYDPQVGEKLDYKRIDEEVIPWLRQQFGVAPGTNLADLFANTIGVPQGMFTADFLKADRERKETFDKILKVDDYRKAYEKLASLSKYAEGVVNTLKQEIDRCDQALQKQVPLQQQQQQLVAEIAQDQTTLQELESKLVTLQVQKEALAAAAQQVQQLEAQMQQLNAQTAGKQQATDLIAQTLKQAETAAKIRDQNRSGYEQFQQAEATLRQLEAQTKQQRTLQQQRDRQRQALFEGEAELTKLNLQLEQLAQMQQEAAQLQPLVLQQQTLEQQQTESIQQLQHLQACAGEKRNLEQHLNRLRQDWRQATQEIDRLRSLEATIAEIPALEQQRDRLQEQLSRIEAARQFEAELQQLVTQTEFKHDRVHSQAQQAHKLLQQMAVSSVNQSDSLEIALSTIAASIALNSELLAALNQILRDLSVQISAPQLNAQLKQIRRELDQGYQHRADLATLDTKLLRQAQIKAEGEQTQGQINTLAAQLETEPEWQSQYQQQTIELEALGNPRGRSQVLCRDLPQQPKLQSRYSQRQQAQAEITAAIADIDQQLTEFADLEAQIEQQKRICDTYKSAYLAYLQSQNAAAQLPTLETDLQAAIAELQQLQVQLAQVRSHYQAAIATYDPEQFQQIDAIYNATYGQRERLIGSLPQQQQRLADLDVQLTELQTIADNRAQAELQLKQKDKIRKFIKFSREAYKKAGPRITEQYVQTIAREADRLFRELLNRANVGLQWTRDYEVIVQEGAHSRRFINLSGGEQMCAALAIRLALLKVLADIDIAFFDEPTTNMDRPRRVHLAEAIANIKTFRQIFVISHDDTFEQVTENVILLERDG